MMNAFRLETALVKYSISDASSPHRPDFDTCLNFFMPSAFDLDWKQTLIELTSRKRDFIVIVCRHSHQLHKLNSKFICYYLGYTER